MKKHCFLTLFAERRAKSSKYADFSHFLRTLYKVTWKTWKNTALSYFLHNIAQKNAVLSLFLRTLYKVSLKKREKNNVFSHFLRPVAQKAQKTFFFRISFELCTKCLVKREKTLFSNTFCGTSQEKVKKLSYLTLFAEPRPKCSKTLFFNIFCELCTKCLEKRERTLFSHTLCITSRKKTLFLNFICELCTKCLEKREKTLFSHTFCETSRKKLKKRCFFVFYVNFVQSVSKNIKNTVFSHFWRNVA